MRYNTTYFMFPFSSTHLTDELWIQPGFKKISFYSLFWFCYSRQTQNHHVELAKYIQCWINIFKTYSTSSKQYRCHTFGLDSTQN